MKNKQQFDKLVDNITQQRLSHEVQNIKILTSALPKETELLLNLFLEHTTYETTPLAVFNSFKNKKYSEINQLSTVELSYIIDTVRKISINKTYHIKETITNTIKTIETILLEKTKELQKAIKHDITLNASKEYSKQNKNQFN